MSGGEREKCRKEKQTLQRSPSPFRSEGEVPPIVHEVLRSLGQPLDPATRVFMEPRFGRDFSQVWFHADIRAAETARAVNAKAYMIGEEQYAPETTVVRLSEV
jgi:hypothetical protein